MEKTQYMYNAKVIRVIDGDTVILSVDCGFNITKTDSFRLIGIDSPELKGINKEKGKEAKEFLKTLIENQNIIVETFKDKQGKYGRYLAVIWLGDININQVMLDKGYANIYPT